MYENQAKKAADGKEAIRHNSNKYTIEAISFNTLEEAILKNANNVQEHIKQRSSGQLSKYSQRYDLLLILHKFH